MCILQIEELELESPLNTKHMNIVGLYLYCHVGYLLNEVIYKKFFEHNFFKYLFYNYNGNLRIQYFILKMKITAKTVSNICRRLLFSLIKNQL